MRKELATSMFLAVVKHLGLSWELLLVCRLTLVVL